MAVALFPFGSRALRAVGRARELKRGKPISDQNTFLRAPLGSTETARPGARRFDSTSAGESKDWKTTRSGPLDTFFFRFQAPIPRECQKGQTKAERSVLLPGRETGAKGKRRGEKIESEIYQILLNELYKMEGHLGRKTGIIEKRAACASRQVNRRSSSRSRDEGRLTLLGWGGKSEKRRARAGKNS